MLKETISGEGYFAPMCTARHMSVRYYSWEPSRYVGDATHFLALVVCIAASLRDEGPEGVSMKTHVLFLLVFSVRFANVFVCEQSVYLVIYKVLLWTTTLKIIMLLAIRGAARDDRDTMPIIWLCFAILILTCVFGSFSLQDHGLVFEVLWIYSNYVEGIAMLPQYIYSYRDGGNRSMVVFTYVALMGGYRLIFGLTWFHTMLTRGDYMDVSSLCSGVIGIAFFADFLKFHAAGSSLMSSACIAVDDHILDAEEVALEIARGGTFEEAVQKDLSPNGAGRCSPAAAVVGRPMEVELACFTEEENERSNVHRREVTRPS